MKNVDDNESVDINQIFNKNISVDYWKLMLGIKYVYEFAPKGVQYYFPYFDIGKLFWDKIKNNVHSFVCEENKPKEWISDYLLDGNIESLALALIKSIKSKYSVSVDIAVPIVAILIKTGLNKFCALKMGDANSKDIDLNNEIKSKSIIKQVNKNKSSSKL